MKKTFLVYSERLRHEGFEIKAENLDEAERKVLEDIDIQEV